MNRDSDLIRTAGDFQQVVTELSLHRAVDLTDRFVEDHLVEFLHHLTGSEAAQIATALARRALGVCCRKLTEVGAALNFGLQILTLFLGIHENMSRSGLSHGLSPESGRVV